MKRRQEAGRNLGSAGEKVVARWRKRRRRRLLGEERQGFERVTLTGRQGSLMNDLCHTTPRAPRTPKLPQAYIYAHSRYPYHDRRARGPHVVRGRRNKQENPQGIRTATPPRATRRVLRDSPQQKPCVPTQAKLPRRI
jgi:hypothetical protein